MHDTLFSVKMFLQLSETDCKADVYVLSGVMMNNLVLPSFFDCQQTFEDKHIIDRKNTCPTTCLNGSIKG